MAENKLMAEIADILGKNWGDNWEVHNRVAKEITTYLHSQGVVIKVDREMPLPSFENSAYGAMKFTEHLALRRAILNAGYVATEPLVNTATEEPTLNPLTSKS